MHLWRNVSLEARLIGTRLRLKMVILILTNVIDTLVSYTSLIAILEGGVGAQ